MASTLVAMASNLLADGLQLRSDGLPPTPPRTRTRKAPSSLLCLFLIASCS